MLRFALALTFVTVVEAVTTQSPAKAPQWVPEQGVSVAQRDGAIELNGSRGWIRAELGVFRLRAGVRLPLPTQSSSGSVSIRSRPGYDRRRLFAPSSRSKGTRLGERCAGWCWRTALVMARLMG